MPMLWGSTEECCFPSKIKLFLAYSVTEKHVYILYIWWGREANAASLKNNVYLKGFWSSTQDVQNCLLNMIIKIIKT